LKDEEQSLFARAQQLRAEAAELERERVTELEKVTSKLEKHLDSQDNDGHPPVLPENGISDTKMSYRMVDLPILLPQWLLLCCTLPYLLPLLDAWRLFGIALAEATCPTLALEWTTFLQHIMLEDWQPLFELAQPLVLFAMPTIAVNRRLPQLLRFNLNQAFVIDFALCLTFHASSFSRWLSLQRGDLIYVPEQAELPVMPGSRAILLLLGICLFYCISCTIKGAFPDGIPYVSAEAKKSMGSQRSHRQLPSQ